ncbi:cobyric acid synthase [bacterium]|nr:MAG: cobyric acid synthase [bacterium]
MTRARAIQICGTGSGVGKSVIVSALCRIFLQDGFRVCPFKAQNMALNSFVTKNGSEIGRAQAVQARACGIEPSADMNPVLLKPSSDRRSQVVIRGNPVGNMSAVEYVRYKKKAQESVLKSFEDLSRQYEIVVIEGAGSPAEVNLKAHDIVNMAMAEAANAPVILVGDIDKGGVFAWIVGTLELLTEAERARIKGIIINKFRGDKRLLSSGIRFLEKKTGIKVLGVVPYFKDIKIPEEDSVSLENDASGAVLNTQYARRIKISIIKLPHISNFTDFDALEKEQDVSLNYVESAEQLNGADVIIIPGTKNTIGDLQWLRRSGLAEQILRAARKGQGTALIGICGGYQMLGQRIYDAEKIESGCPEIGALGLLPVITRFNKKKTLSQVKARAADSRQEVYGYEIHHGRTRRLNGVVPAFKITERRGKRAEYSDGASSKDGKIWGTYIHGVFDADNFRRDFLNGIRQAKGWTPLTQNTAFDSGDEFNKLAGLLRKNINLRLLYRILNHGF